MSNIITSRYNICVYNEKEELLIYNTLSNNRLKFSPCDAPMVKKILELASLQNIDATQYSTSEKDYYYMNLLKNYGILLNNNTDEIRMAQEKFLSMAYGNDMLDITIIPTEECDFCCVYCYEREKFHVMSDETAVSILKYLKKNLKYYRHLLVSWFGGEPLLASDRICNMMKEIKKIAAKYGVTVRSNITTNGYNLTLPVFHSLISSGVNFCQITIDGLEDLHNQQRPHKVNDDSFSTIINNLIQIRDFCQFSRYEIKIRINISEQADQQRHQYLEFMKNLFGGFSNFSFDFEWIRDWDKEKNPDNNFATSPIICANWIAEAIKLGLPCSDFLNGSCGMFFCEACKKSGFIINYDGTIHKCTLAIESERYKVANNIGYLDYRGRINIDLARESAWIGFSFKNSECENCALYPLCMGVNCPWITQIQKKNACMPLRSLISTYMLSSDKNSKFLKVEYARGV